MTFNTAGGAILQAQNGTPIQINAGVAVTTTTNLTTNAGNANITVASHTTGVSINSTGTGDPIDNRPPYYATCIIEYTGIGA
jgi:hypothetical protein